ncbi:hypothetical protein ACIBSW_34455 [Actinoplanes sp. NPDC049668]|uniref:hypothetical protein n=1 Tax=unclassified Actinoplanes TaxID=2626549 RepID=UPI0033BEFC29
MSNDELNRRREAAMRCAVIYIRKYPKMLTHPAENKEAWYLFSIDGAVTPYVESQVRRDPDEVRRELLEDADDFLHGPEGQVKKIKAWYDHVSKAKLTPREAKLVYTLWMLARLDGPNILASYRRAAQAMAFLHQEPEISAKTIGEYLRRIAKMGFIALEPGKPRGPKAKVPRVASVIRLHI